MLLRRHLQAIVGAFLQVTREAHCNTIVDAAATLRVKYCCKDFETYCKWNSYTSASQNKNRLLSSDLKTRLKREIYFQLLLDNNYQIVGFPP
mmetsp:Transcript_5525/g.8155  ORF Transcript_5525/g.8155 Transcript_5525/m.8155 type:complete len:92 (-) Transcript_5525:12-287(-)